MRIRQIIAALMILLSLSAQARTVFACGMMAGAAPATCCCPSEGKDHCPPAGNGACCDQAAAADALFAHSMQHMGGKHVHHDHAADLGPGPAPHLLPASFDTGDRPGPARPAASSPGSLPLYLVTARLRL